MATFDKADPRWIVADRKDGANVNNWHWTEKNIKEWSKEAFDRMLGTHKIEGTDDSLELKTEKFDGDCNIMNRKRKVVFYYHLDIAIEWSDPTTGNKGTMTVTQVDQDEDDFEVEFSSPNSSQPTAQNIKKKGTKFFRLQMTKLNDEIQALITRGGDTSAAVHDDDFADLTQDDEATDFIVSETSISKPEFSETISVSFKKSSPDEPMGTVLEPDTLELLEVHKDTAAYSNSLLHDLLSFNLLSINNTPVTDMDEVRGASKGQIDIELKFGYAGGYETIIERSTLVLNRSNHSTPSQVKGVSHWARSLAKMNRPKITESTAADALLDAKKALKLDQKSDGFQSLRLWIGVSSCGLNLSDRMLMNETCRAINDYKAIPYWDALLKKCITFNHLSSLPTDVFCDDMLYSYSRRLSAMVDDEPDVAFLKKKFGYDIRKKLRPSDKPEVRQLARRVGNLLQD